MDLKRELLRHLLATVAYRGEIAVCDAPASFAEFRAGGNVRSPGELLAHLGDLLEGSLHLLKGDLVRLESPPLPWDDGVARFLSTAAELDAYLASDAPLAYPVETLVQGPVGDALTHIGQLLMLRRMAGIPVRPVAYFAAEIRAGKIGRT